MLADLAHQDPFMPHSIDDLFRLCRRRGLGFAIGNQIHTEEQPASPNVSDDVVFRHQVLKSPQHVLADSRGITDQIFLFDDIEHGKTDGT